LGFGLIVICIILSFFIFRLGKNTFNLQLFSNKRNIGNLIKPIIILGVIYYLLVSIAIPAIKENQPSNVGIEKLRYTDSRILTTKPIKIFESKLYGINDTKLNLIFKKSDQSQITIYGNREVIDNFDLNLGPDLYILNRVYPFKVCFFCNYPTTVVIESNVLEEIVLDPSQYNSIILQDYQQDYRNKTLVIRNLNSQNNDDSEKSFNNTKNITFINSLN
jgi:hypothetical protein